MGIKDNQEDYLEKEYSIEEYIQMEELSDIKHEYHAGHIRAMSGGSLNHSLISTNITSELRSKIKEKGKSCTTFNSDAKVYSHKSQSFVYPDTTVVCGDIETSDVEKQAITNPTLIVEVLSKSTGNYDRGDKFRLYRSFPSFKEYILIDQDRPIIDILFKGENHQWKFAGYVGLDKIIHINSLNLDIPMSEIYQGTIDLKDPNLRINL